MKWRDALRNITKSLDSPESSRKIGELIDAKAKIRKPTNPPKYEVGDTVQTTYTAWPNTQTTEHTIQRIWTWEEGYTGLSGYAYHLIPAPRGSNHRPLDEGWLSTPPTINKPSIKRSKTA